MSKQKFNTALIDRIFTHRSENYRTALMPWGAIEIDVRGEANISKTNIKRIEKEYDCELDMILNSTPQCCGCGANCDDDNYVTLHFENKNVKFRNVKFDCNHDFDFDVYYDIGKEEFCIECNKKVKVNYESVLNDMQSLDKSIKEANK
jgi:hypothetical protein